MSAGFDSIPNCVDQFVLGVGKLCQTVWSLSLSLSHKPLELGQVL